MRSFFPTPRLVIAALTAGVALATSISIDPGNVGFTATASAAAVYRSFDGSGNNKANPSWGAAGTQLLRLGPSFYSDGVSIPAGQTRPGTRMVSNAVSAQSASIPNLKGITGLLWQWGQFVDHDIGLSLTNNMESLPILVPSGDPQFSGSIPFNRSTFDPATGEVNGTPRQQVNEITAFIDASNVYGSDQATANSLRSFSGGRLKTSSSANGDLLPFDGVMFHAGDVRANEQSGLTALHTLFMREHNRIAGELAATHQSDPLYTDERLYQEARKMVGAMIQGITYNEFLPALLGGDAFGAYGGYDETVNPGISNEFSAAAYRFGHSMLSPTLLRLDANGNEIAAGHLPLEGAFFNPSHIVDADNGGIEPILRGLVSQAAQDVDPFVVDAVRNMLFGPPVDVGFDLAALNMQRGRDHGLPSYNDMRSILPGLDEYLSWDDTNFLPGVKEALMAVYSNIDDVDLWIGGLAEVHVNDGMMGELFSAILIDQFERLRAGDRFWYESGIFEPEWLDYIESSTFSAVVMRNTGIASMRTRSFYVPEPGTIALFSVGLACMVFERCRKQKARLHPSP